MTAATAIAILVPLGAVIAVCALLVVWVARRRRPPPPPRRPRDQPDPERAVELARAMIRETSLVGLDVPNVVSISVAAAVASAAVIALAAMGMPSLLGGIIAAGLFALIATEVFYRAWPPRVARATAAHAFLGSWEAKRFRSSTGSAPPTSADRARTWLTENPETDANRWVRPQLLAWTGAFDEADAVVARTRADTPAENFERLANEVYVNFVAGRPVDLDALAGAAESVGDAGSDERLRAVAEVAAAQSRERLVARRADWLDPLVEAQEQIGDRAMGVIRADTWSARFRSMAFLAACFVAVGVVVSLLSR